MAGGKDADDVLREHGAPALRDQLASSRPFVEVLFERERLVEPLETPEAYAGLKARLRKLAGAIADRDLSQMYREALLDRFETLRTLARPAATLSGAGARSGRGALGRAAPWRAQGRAPPGSAAA